MNIFYILSPLLAIIMRFIYGFVGNYGWSIIIFTVLIGFLRFPLAVKQQKSMAKMSVYQPLIAEIQKKYANNRQKQNEELMKLQEEYGYSPTAGCLPMFLNMFVMLGVVGVVAKPLEYIVGVGSDVIASAIEQVNALGLATLNAANYTSQSTLMQLVRGMDMATATSLGFTEAQVNAIQGFDMKFFGVDLAGTPSLAFNMLLIWPLLSIVTMCLLNVITMRASGQEMQGSMKWMPWIMSLMFVWISFTIPVGFSMYYTISNLMMFVQTLITKKMYDPEKMKAQMQAELEAKRAERKKKKAVTVVDKATGETVTREVGEAEMIRLRLEKARAEDAEKYKDERTTPLTNTKEG